jgi:acetylornithine deacetylase/succinyl-diaminopimelate desuccinylase-like protein
LDLRLSPRTSAEQADAELGAEVERLSKLHGIEYEMRRTTTIPGTTTTPGNFIIETAIEAWEEIEHRGHQPVAGLSGATDANILRGFGIPTARVGLPKANIRGIDFQQGMNTVAVAAMRKLTHLLLYVAIATCG